MTQDNNGNMTIRLLSYVFVAVIAFAGGLLVGNSWTGDSDGGGDGDQAVAVDAAQDGAGGPLAIGDSPVLGKSSAPVTIVEFSDFQCPYCQKGRKTIQKLHEKYPNDVKVAFKHYPLGMHPQAPSAAKAAIAAQKQGKFWKMHDWLFGHQKQFRAHSDDFKDWVAGGAKDLGLDVAQFKKDFDAKATEKKLAQNKQLGDKVNVRGTPHFFVNGKRIKGAKPLPAFEKIVKKQLEQAKKLKKSGMARAEIYDKMVDQNFDGGQNPNKPSAKGKKAGQKVEYVPVEANDPVYGNTDDPVVTIVEFSDFQCPFCGRAFPTVNKIKKQYGDKVRFVFKQLPLGMHQWAKPAAKAAVAAQQQGKFWEMHDKLFENQKQFKQHGDNFKEWVTGFAKELGLNVAKFKKDFDSPKVAAAIKADQQMAQKVGARGTPNFWINGRNLPGAQPFGKFKSVIDSEIKKSEQLAAKKGLSGDKLYKASVAANKKAAAAKPAPSPQKARAKKPSKVDPSKLTVGDAPTKGAADAPVTIIEFSDFQCPFCKRGTKNLDVALEDFTDQQVRVVYKHFPLPMHPHAKPAAKASMAAAEQGKFWEMHDLLFANNRQLGTSKYEELAKKIGLNMAKFKSDMQKPAYAKKLQSDTAQGRSVGVRGTPAFFINGTMVSGAQPTSKFTSVINQELKKAD